MKRKFQKGFFIFILSLLGSVLPGIGLVNSFAQEVTVTGKVIDVNDLPIPGVNVVIKGTSLGTITNLDGEYSLTVDSPDATLSFSFVGYLTEDAPIENRSTINVTLVEDIQALEEVVVIGYGVQKKSNVTGSISQVKSEDLENRTASNVTQSLQGKTSGVHVIQTSGMPGATGSVRIRGFSSNAASDPLFIVDGLKVEDISYLDPNSIEKMEVLKDAASAAIYGAQAGNGVILITTKAGNKSKGKIFYDYQRSIQTLARIPEMMNSNEYIEYMLESEYITQSEVDEFWDGETSTKWTDVAFDKGIIDRHTVGFQGGNENGNFFLSLSSFNNDGIVTGNKDVYKRLNAQINADYKIKDWLKVGLTSTLGQYEIKSVDEGSEYGSLILSALVIDPLTHALYEEDELPDFMAANVALGKLYLQDDEGRYYGVSPFLSRDVNPLIYRDRTDKGTDGMRALGTFYADFTPIKGLVVTSKLGYRISSSTYTSFTAPYYASADILSETYSLREISTNGLYYQWENFANYNKSIQKHDFGVMAGMSYSHSDSRYVNGYGNALISGEENFRYLSYLDASATLTLEGEPTESSQISYFGRFSWGYDGKYMAQVNFRADAFDSSKLAEESRWGYFPSISTGWVISKENFMQDGSISNYMTYLKLRASWGKNGNISVLSDYPYATSIDVGDWQYQFDVSDETWTYGSATSGLSNNALVWENSEQIDMGIDARFLNDRLTFTFDYFNKKTNGFLTSITPPLETGATSVYVNAGDVTNYGYEFELGWRSKIGDLSYGINSNIATLKNEVTYMDPSLPQADGASQAGTTITMCEKGQPIYYMYGYKFDKVDPLTGDPTFIDVNGDGEITADDKTNIGSGIPDFTYGITINLEYKGFDFIAFGSGAYGNDIWMLLTRNDYKKRNRLKLYYDERWTANNTTAERPRAGANDEDKYWLSDANVFSGAYFKIKQIQFGYTLPKELTSKISVDRLRVYTSLDDYFTFTKYKGFDPEASSESINGVGLDKGSYPTSKKVSVGLNLTF